MNTPVVRLSGSAKGAALLKLSAVMLAAVTSAFASAISWTGTTDTNFETGTNWGGVGGVAPANDLTTDYGVFSGTPTVNQPTLTANRSIGGLQFGSTGGWTLGGAFTLTLGNVQTVGTTTPTTGVAIDASALTSGTDNISVGTITIGTSPQTWLVGTNGTLNVTSAVGSGGAVTVNFGDANNGGTLMLGGTTDNSFLGLTLTKGTVQLGKTSTSQIHALGGSATINGGTLQLAGTGGDQIASNAGVTVNGGTFDLNGRSESMSFLSAAATGGTTTNSAMTASTLTLTSTGGGGGNYQGDFSGNLSILVTGGATFGGLVNNAGTITNSGTAPVNITGIIGSNVTGVIQNSATSAMTLNSASNVFTSGVLIKSGSLIIKNGTAAGTGTISIGDASTNLASTLNYNGSATFTVANAISVAGSGANTLTATSWSQTFSGLVTFNNNTTLNVVTNNTGGSDITLSGNVTGTGNLILQSNAALTNKNSRVTLSGTSINNVGTITNSGTGSVTGGSIDTTISGNIGPNVTSVTQNSLTSALTLSGTNTFTNALAIKAGTVNAQGNGLGGTTGVGTITLGDVANTGAAATLNWMGSFTTNSSAINVVGTGARTLSVTSFGPTYTGAVTLNNNTTLNVVTNNTGGSDITLSGGVTGTGNLILQSNAVLTNKNSRVTLSGASINNVGTITNSGTGSVTGGSIDTTISANIGNNVTQVIQNSANSALILSGANTFGQMIVTLGKASTTTTGTFGSGNVTVNTGTILTLGNNTSIADTANLIFSATLGTTINLSFSGTEIINSLSSISGTFASARTGYSAGELNTIFGGTYFTGSGLVTITSSAIPEPSTYAALFGVLAIGGAFWKRRSRFVGKAV